MLRPPELFPLLEQPVAILVTGCARLDSEDHAVHTVDRRATGYAAYLLEVAVAVSIQTEILSASARTPICTDDDRDERERAETKIHLGTNLLRTALPAALFSALAKRLGF